ncbi:hypothetical protein MMC17_005586 [Xylographa soralifera]|nr:hypothetical protein [Xylographa soralifera]
MANLPGQKKESSQEKTQKENSKDQQDKGVAVAEEYRKDKQGKGESSNSSGSTQSNSTSQAAKTTNPSK